MMELYIVALIVLILVCLICCKYFYGGLRRNSVGILGLSGAGKTNLFYQLCHQKNVLSVTSISRSQGLYEVDPQKKVVVYDLPGHERIRYQHFNDVKSDLRALIFVIDASLIPEQTRDVAEFLYNVLCDASVLKGASYLLVACNKQDIATAKGSSLIKFTLEREMNLLRVTKSNQLQGVGGESRNAFLGRRGEDFQFSHLSPMQVDFVETVANDPSQIDQVVEWMQKVAL